LILCEGNFCNYFCMENGILSQIQLAFLGELGKQEFIRKNFYLTGGTALAAFYLGHRYSEDLDFFSEKEFDILQIDVLLKGFQVKFGILNIDFQNSFNRNLFFLHLKDEILKIEFTYFPFTRIEKGIQEWGIEIDSLLDIAVNKLFSVYQRTKARDYIDLYLLCKEKSFTIGELMQKARLKFDWHIDALQLGTQFMKAKDAQDYPRMIREISPKEWQNFFVEEAKKLGQEIIE